MKNRKKFIEKKLKPVGGQSLTAQERKIGYCKMRETSKKFIHSYDNRVCVTLYEGKVLRFTVTAALDHFMKIVCV